MLQVEQLYLWIIYIMNKYLVLIFFAFLSLMSNANERQISEAPDVLIKTLSEQLVIQLRSLHNDDTRHHDLKGIVENTLMPHVDSNYVAYAVLGKYLKKTTKEQRETFSTLFKAHLIGTYASALTKFTNQKIQVQPISKKAMLKRSLSVKATLLDDTKPPIDILFKLRQNKKSEQWKIYDFVAEGISLIHTKHYEFARLIGDKGIDGAIAFLSKK